MIQVNIDVSIIIIGSYLFILSYVTITRFEMSDMNMCPSVRLCYILKVLHVFSVK